MSAHTGVASVHTGSHWGMYTAEVENGQVIGVKPFEKDPHPSPIIEAAPSAVHDASRIAGPMVRKGWLQHGPGGDSEGRGREPFVPVGWEQALDLVAEELKRVKGQYGNEAIYASSGWGSAGCFHNAQAQLGRFLNCFGGFVSQVTNYSFGAAGVILPHVVGTMGPLSGGMHSWPAIAENTKLMVLFGGMSPKNAQMSKDGVGQHDVADWQANARSAGVEFVSISPLRDDVADTLDAQWLPIRPNTDCALMLGLMHTLINEKLHDEGFLDRYCAGFERFRPYVLGETDGVAKSAEWASNITEVDVDTIQTLARRMAANRTMISASWSIQRADHGEQAYWMAVTLAAMLGQIGLPGGGIGFGYATSNGGGNPRMHVPPPTLPTGRNQVDAFIPVARLTDMLLNPGAPLDFNGQKLTYPDIRLVYWCGGNPFHKQQDINRLLRAWRKPETIIIHEPWWTPSARRADIVLPCTTTLERNDIGASFSDRFWFAMNQAIPPVGGARNEYDIYADLSDRLGFREAFTEGRDEMEWLGYIYEVARGQLARRDMELPTFSGFWDTSYLEFPVPDNPPETFGAFRADPEANPLKTPTGKIEVFSDKIDGFGYDDCPGHPVWLEPAEWLGAPAAEAYPLHLISNQPRFRLHSQLDCGAVSQASKVAGREPVEINPKDAIARDIRDGDVVRVYNSRGACLAGAVVTDSIRPGVVQLATGAWYDPIDPGEIGSMDKHGNPNVLTLDKGTSKLAQCCSAQSALVEVERFEGTPPEVTAFVPPPMAEA